MNYGEILSKAWKIIWKNKILWLFGILAGCSASGVGGSSGGWSSAGGRGTNAAIKPDSLNFLGSSTQKIITDFAQFIESIDIWVWILLVIVLLVVVFILSVVFFLLGTLGETGVIAGASMEDQVDEDTPPLSLRKIFSALKPHYWKVVVLKLGYALASLIAMISLIVPTLKLMSRTCCVGFILLIPIGWFIQTMLFLTTIAIVVEGLGFVPAITRAWRMITGNLLQVLIIFLILGIGGAIVGVLISLPLLIVPLPFAINLAILASSGSGSLIAGLILSVLLALVILPISILLRGVLHAYLLSAWTLAYRRLPVNEDLKPTLLNETPVED
ncbi:MAG TPA: hypothetical protein PLA02_09465 [Brevefilum fermentans]|jgi:hypothetical protein|nr:hypothetical protein [Brevefilum fermentans]HQA29425.1 hypothetical protein [Brevefilum fermentans]